MTAKASHPAALGAALIVLTLLGFFQFPGHTFLQSDTQIYIPMFERLEHATLYQGDPLIGTIHVALTIYDETTLLLRRITGFNFASVLEGEQIALRVLGLWGIFLIATSVGCSDAAAILLAAIIGLGGTIVGPAVLTVEYEPVPRGFALSLILLAIGLALHGRLAWSCAVASVALLFHAPATWPFWPLLLLSAWRSKDWRSLWPLSVGSLILAGAFLAQQGSPRSQPLFLTIDPPWEAIMRLRVAYDWIGQWPDYSVVNFVAMAGLALAALWRIRTEVPFFTHRIFLAGFPLLGVFSIGLSALLLDVGKWSLMAQAQPARASLFAIVFAQVNCGVAAMWALKRNRLTEACLWLIPVLVVPVKQNFSTPFTLPQIITIALLVALTLAGMKIARGGLGWIVVAGVGCWMIPHYARTVNYPALHNDELTQLSNWARTSTPESALFEFPVAQRSLEPGVFRALALRPVWIDWKAGGQVNYFRDFAVIWWKRWQEVSSGKLTPSDWKMRGVRYLVYSGTTSDPLAEPVYTNPRYRVYDLQTGPANP